MNILSVPIFESSFVLAKSIIEVINSKDYSGRYHITESGAFIIMEKPNNETNFLNILNDKLKRFIKEEIKELEEDDCLVDENDIYNIYEKELENFISFFDEVMKSNFSEFAVESI